MNILYFHYILVVMMHFQDTVDTVSRDVFAISIYVIHCYEEYLQCLVVIHLVRRYSPFTRLLHWAQEYFTVNKHTHICCCVTLF